jgi:serine protease Do
MLNGAFRNLFLPLTDETSNLVERVRKSVVRVYTGDGHGAGVVWHPAGLIITNHHVATRDSLTVEFADGHRISAQVFGRDPSNDLAALFVKERNLPAIAVGDSRSLRVGEMIIAVGHPFGVLGNATMGIISGTGTRVRMGNRERERLQADVELAPGNSGGPLVDTEGRVVGIASMIVSPGIALAIPSHVIQSFVRQVAPGLESSDPGFAPSSGRRAFV